MAPVSPAGGLRPEAEDEAGRGRPCAWRPGLLFLSACSDKQPPDPWPPVAAQCEHREWPSGAAAQLGAGNSVFVFHAGFLQG